jgi:hypothetical protein
MYGLFSFNTVYLVESFTFPRNLSLLSLGPKSKLAVFFLELLFDPEDRSDKFIRNVGMSRSYKAFEPRTPYTFAIVPVSFVHET